MIKIIEEGKIYIYIYMRLNIAINVEIAIHCVVGSNLPPPPNKLTSLNVHFVLIFKSHVLKSCHPLFT